MNDLNVGAEAIERLPERTRGSTPLDISVCENFENWTPNAEAEKANLNERDDNKGKSSAQRREPTA